MKKQETAYTDQLKRIIDSAMTEYAVTVVSEPPKSLKHPTRDEIIESAILKINQLKN